MSAGKPKALLKQTKGKKKKEQILEEADDYLAVAVDNEDAMGKHRGGDAVKSLRFARKALDLYEQGLSKYPRNFDLAYNKARLELEVATHPTLVKTLDVPVTNVLDQALRSHRYALSLDPDNADTLFNIAQVLTTIAEYIAKDDTISDIEAITYLQQALEHQTRCLEIQETKYSESRRFHEAAMGQRSLEDNDDNDEDIIDDDGGAKLDPTTTTAFEDKAQWFSIVEPVTINTLIDTVLSQLSTLTALCTVLTSSITSADTHSSPPLASSPASIESLSSKLLTRTLPLLVSNNTDSSAQRNNEIHRTKAIFTSSLLDLAFHIGDLTPEAYLSEINTAFADPVPTPGLNSESQPDSDPETSIAHAKALITYNSSLTDLRQPSSLESVSAAAAVAAHRWTALSHATAILTKASQQPTTKSSGNTHLLATSHLLRADIALLMYALSQPPISYPQAVSNRAQLLKNAEVFYRNAGKLFGGAGGGGTGSGMTIGLEVGERDDEAAVARFRGAVVEILKLGAGVGAKPNVGVDVLGILKAASREKSDGWRREQIGEMVDEGLVAEEAFGL